MPPTVTRAPKDTHCHGCNARPTVQLRGACITRLCPSCLALLAAGPQRKVFEAKNANGQTVRFRSDGEGWVEYQYQWWNADKRHVLTPSMLDRNDLGTPSCFRAIADAIEDGGAP